MKRDTGNETEWNLTENCFWDEKVIILAREGHFPSDLSLLEYMK